MTTLMMLNPKIAPAPRTTPIRRSFQRTGDAKKAHDSIKTACTALHPFLTSKVADPEDTVVPATSTWLPNNPITAAAARALQCVQGLTTHSETTGRIRTKLP